MSLPSNKAQMISDEFHAISQESRALLERLQQLQADADAFRVETQMSGLKTHRTLRHFEEAATNLASADKSIILAHRSAQAAIERERADIPWDCPDASVASTKEKLAA